MKGQGDYFGYLVTSSIQSYVLRLRISVGQNNSNDFKMAVYLRFLAFFVLFSCEFHERGSHTVWMKNRRHYVPSSPLTPTFNQWICLADFTHWHMLLSILSILTATTLAQSTTGCHLPVTSHVFLLHSPA